MNSGDANQTVSLIFVTQVCGRDKKQIKMCLYLHYETSNFGSIFIVALTAVKTERAKINV